MKQCIHIYTNSHPIFYAYDRSSGRWWQRKVMANFVPNIQLGPVLDEDLHHLHMAFISGVHQRGPSLLSETDTHSERDTTACHHTLPTYRPLWIYKHTCINTFKQYANSKTLAHPYVTTVWASIQIAHTEIHRSYKQAITYTLISCKVYCTYMSTIRFADTQQISLIRIHTYIHAHAYRW